MKHRIASTAASTEVCGLNKSQWPMVAFFIHSWWMSECSFRIQKSSPLWSLLYYTHEINCLTVVLSEHTFTYSSFYWASSTCQHCGIRWINREPCPQEAPTPGVLWLAICAYLIHRLTGLSPRNSESFRGTMYHWPASNTCHSLYTTQQEPNTSLL